ncbi:MAG TPA: gliding motility-associated protein GldE [Bacteroidales bacterium]|nr:gliding motility-associated protein GldE [Bacteroidales bacterium]
MDPDPFRYSLIISVITTDSINFVIIGFVVVAILLFCSGMISASEVAYFSLLPKDKNRLKHSKSNSAKQARKLLEKPDYLLATILVTNNFVNVAIIILSTYLSAILFSGVTNKLVYFLIQMVGVTFLILLFGEMSPKIIAGKFPVKIAKIMSFPLLVSGKVLYPLSYILIKSTDLVNRRLKNKRNSDISIEELSQAIELASDDLKEDKDVLEGILNSANLEVKEIMTSRVDVFAIEYNSKFTKVLGQIVETGFSRIPVYIDNLDNIKGILYIKDVLPYISLQNKEDFKWQKLLRPHFIVPETKKINELLSEFKSKKMHIALVVDEYGGVNGMVTLEDILEEFVGEIHDESDKDNDENLFIKIDERNFEFDAKISLVDFCKLTDTDYSRFYELKGESDSLAGLILEINGEIPKKHTTINIEGFEFTVSAADERRIKKVKVKIPDEK